jgi:hypothetical protein
MDSIDWDLFSSFAGLLCLASTSIFAGAHGSLPVRTLHCDTCLKGMRLLDTKEVGEGHHEELTVC